MHPTAETINIIRREIGELYFERESAIEAIALAFLSGEHVYLVGVPGTGKTEMGTEAISRIVGDPLWRGPNGEAGTMSWRQQFLKTTPLEKLVGGVDVPALRERGEYHHKIDGFLPTARLALADEVGKASPMALDPLLSMMAAGYQKRLFDNNAKTMIVALLTMIATSNEELDEEEHAAIWDRFLIREEVLAIKDPANLMRLASLEDFVPARRTTLEFADLHDAVVNEVPAITVPTDVLEKLMISIPGQLAKKGLLLSSRRLRKAIRVMQASAFLNGRTQCEMDDLAVLRFIAWDKLSQREEITRTVLEASNAQLGEVLTIEDAVKLLASQLAAIDPGKSEKEITDQHVAASAQLRGAKRKLGVLTQQSLSLGRSVTKIREVEALVDQTLAVATKAMYSL